jgi:hypothetical protein
MPRLSDRQYLKAYRQLRRFWLHDSSIFSYLSSAEQWQSHAFFQPSHELTDQELLGHRVTITGERPSLPHQAGRALAKLHVRSVVVAVRRQRVHLASKRPPTKQAARHLTVQPPARPAVDAEKLARAFIWLAHDLERRRQSEPDDQDRFRP